MTTTKLETDYLVIGAGAMAMAFTDELLSNNSGCRVVMVDRHARAGGHWNDAYPFVSLHQPAAYYGVNSEKLGSGGAALASRNEVLAYYERVLAKLSDTGRLRLFPMCEYRGAGRFESLAAPDQQYEVKARKIVDATYMNVQVPSIRPPQYDVSPGVALVPLNELPKVREAPAGYVIIGAGKTGMDAVLFLLDQGVGPDRIQWIMPNDAWFFDRAQIQPGRFTVDGFGTQMEQFASSHSLEEILTRLEDAKRLYRLDSSVWPTKYRCATVSLDELDALRKIEDVVRMGRVVRIEPDEIVLDQGSIPTSADRLHVDCTADGLSARETVPIFDGSQITLQSLFICQQVFSASVIGYVESRFDDEAQKNELCQPVPHPEFNRDFVRASAISMANTVRWGRSLFWWLRRSRLFMASHEPLWKILWSGWRTQGLLAPGKENMRKIFEQEFPGEPFPL